MSPSEQTNQARILVAHLALLVAVACLADTAWADNWTHDRVYGAATVAALAGGQATLARDGADQQARTITHVQTSGATTTITRDYGPSGQKATETVNGTVRSHVYGTGLAPLLRVEGDGSLTYQVGMDTISVGPTGSTTVAHRMADIKQSTVAVLDTEGQPRQQVAYGTLGQATSLQKSGSVFATAAQLSGYESLTEWQLGTDQLIDNRARIYFPTAGRFLALDAAGEALGYEARGNDWISRADYDGYIAELVDVLEKDPSIVVAIGEAHEWYEGIGMLMALIDKLDAKNLPFRIYQESNLLIDYDKPERRVEKLGISKRVLELYKAGRLLDLAQGNVKKLKKGENALIFEQLKKNANPANQKFYNEKDADKYKYQFSRNTLWDIAKVLQQAKRAKEVTILFTGASHLLEPRKKRFAYYRDQDGMAYYLTIHPNKVVSLQSQGTYSLVSQYNLVGIVPGYKTYKDSIDGVYRQKAGYLLTGIDSSEYRIFTPAENLDRHSKLKLVFPSDDDEKSDDSIEFPDILPFSDTHKQLLAPKRQSVPQKSVGKDIEEGKGD